jgi:uncharacterized protein
MLPDASSDGDAWRVAALTMMGPQALQAALTGDGAANWVTAAAASGIPEASLRLGRMLLEGEGIAQDRGAAFQCFQAAARDGDPEAHNMLGRCLENGWGTQTDRRAAAVHYAIAAQAGLDWAQYNLGHMLLSGDGVAQDQATAFNWYAKAVAQGHVRAMNLMARCLEHGWGTAQNKPAAHELYRRSAEGGYFGGAYNYATILAAEGDIEGAKRWFSEALRTAPEPTRSHIRSALEDHPQRAFRALASQA